VGVEIWMMTFVFKHLAKTPASVFLYSWFIYKICMGLVTGVSAFLVSSFTLTLFSLFTLVMLVRINRVVTDLRHTPSPAKWSATEAGAAAIS
jgi:hypothetical protein